MPHPTPESICCWLHYLDLIGQRVTPVEPRSADFRHIVLRADGRSLPAYWRAGLISWRDVVRSYRPPLAFFDLDAKDWRYSVETFIIARPQLSAWLFMRRQTDDRRAGVAWTGRRISSGRCSRTVLCKAVDHSGARWPGLGARRSRSAAVSGSGTAMACRLARSQPGAVYDDVWAGGWEELFPNDAPGRFEGRELPGPWRMVDASNGQSWTRPTARRLALRLSAATTIVKRRLHQGVHACRATRRPFPSRIASEAGRRGRSTFSSSSTCRYN